MSALRLSLAIALAAALFTPPSARAAGTPACMSREKFFATTSVGSVAYIVGAGDERPARHAYKKWCPIADGMTLTPVRSRTYFFGVNNRSGSGGASRYFTAKIFRHSGDTVRNPIVSLRRNVYRPLADCMAAADQFAPPPYRGKSAAANLLDMLDGNPPASPFDQGPFLQWTGQANGGTRLPFAQDISFLRDLPAHVSRSKENWSFNYFSSTFATVPDRAWRACYPVFLVTPYSEDELIVQLSDNGEPRSWTFTIANPS